MIEEPARVVDISALIEPFREDAELLMASVAGERLPVVAHETRRSLTRHVWLIRAGRAPNRNVPQLHGLAIDLVLDPAHVFWKIFHEKPLRLDGTPVEHDDGVAPGSPAAPARSHVARAWRRVEQMATGIGFAFAPPMGEVPACVFLPTWRGICARMRTADTWPAGGGLPRDGDSAHDPRGGRDGPAKPRRQP